MGYSLTQAANISRSLVFSYLFADGYVSSQGTSNGWRVDGCDYFEETGRENADGAYTATVYQCKGDTCRKVGSIRIEPNGAITRWPAIPAHVLKDAREELQRRCYRMSATDGACYDAAIRRALDAYKVSAR